MRTISHHVQQIISETPLLSEVLSEGIGNSAAIARLIRADVEKRAMESVSVQAIAMALHRMQPQEKHTQFGFRFLKKITDIIVRSDLALVFVHSPVDDRPLFKRISTFEEKHVNVVLGVTRGLVETLIIVRGDTCGHLKRALGESVVRSQQNVSSISMHLPVASMPVPGVYYPILKALAWEGINVVELVSAGTELTLFFKNSDTLRALKIVRELTQSSH